MFNYYLAKGTKGIISYHTQIDSIDSTTYKLQCPKHIQNIAISSLSNFTCNYVPKFGKYEVEEFVAEMILIAIAEHDITKLMNTEISFDDSPYNKGFYPKERIRELILSYCTIISEKNGIVELNYIGRPTSN